MLSDRKAITNIAMLCLDGPLAESLAELHLECVERALCQMRIYPFTLFGREGCIFKHMQHASFWGGLIARWASPQKCDELEGRRMLRHDPKKSTWGAL
jgi:hypothetical protein